MNRSTARKRRIIVSLLIWAIAGFASFAIAHQVKAAIKTYQAKQAALPFLVIQDSYGHIHEFHERFDSIGRFDSITVTGPAKIWSPRYGLGIWLKSWEYPRFQLKNTAVNMETQGGSYTIYLQPAGWHSVSHDLWEAEGIIDIHLQ